MQSKRALIAVVAAGSMLLGLLGAGAAPTHASINHFGGDATGNGQTTPIDR